MRDLCCHIGRETLPGRVTRVASADPQDVARLYRPLGALMACAASAASARISAADLVALRSHNRALSAALAHADAVAARNADRDFHEAILGVADNPYIATAIEPLVAPRRGERDVVLQPSPSGLNSVRDHEEIIDALAEHDAACASGLMQKNFGRYWTPADSARLE